MFKISPIPAFKDNYIWLLTLGSRAFVVDPGDAAPVLARLEADGLRLEGILITHHHADHQGGVAELKARYQPVIFAPAKESITGTTHALSGGECIEVLGQMVQVIAVPGHTLGHLAYYASGVLFSGDTLFGAGCGRLFEGTPAQMLASLEHLAALPDETLVYCAHEYTDVNLRFAQAVEAANSAVQLRVLKVAALRTAGLPSVPSTLAEEKASNPFLRCAEQAVIEAALQHAPIQGDCVGGAVNRSKEAVFAAIRGWRNTF
ncbi:MAG: hydroxyacylglutathione hydrolase [Azonexus sp.]|nr:hydroxyacylglutathione hydrolase [Azonexus sp.]MDZ4315911.1 hydroxyacylglutathione hydrolase [Azonexus sp.]